jgi:hypothetical protein
MLSKEVKLRRRINRKRRKQPAWRTVMQSLKQHQINLLKIQRNGRFGGRTQLLDNPIYKRGATGTADDVPDLKLLKENMERSKLLSHQQRHMTRLEFYQETGRTYGWRKGAELVAKSNIEIADDCLKMIKKRR